MKANALFAAVVTAVASLVILQGETSSVTAAASSTLRVVPNGLRITASFRGATLGVAAEVPAEAGAAVEISGVTHTQRLLVKGRRGGLWMNVGEVRVEGAPSLYLVMTTKNGAPSLSETPSSIGYGALAGTVEFFDAAACNGKTFLFRQLVKLKEREGLYGVFPGALKVKSLPNGREEVEGHVALPGNIAPGDYRIVLSVFNHGKLLEQRTTELSVQMAGLTAILVSLAHQRALLYGLLAVAIAIATGFAMGFVFKGKGAH